MPTTLSLMRPSALGLALAVALPTASAASTAPMQARTFGIMPPWIVPSAMSVSISATTARGTIDAGSSTSVSRPGTSVR